MYTAKIINKNFLGDRLTVVVEITDGVDTFTETIHINQAKEADFIPRIVRQKVAERNRFKEYADSLTIDAEVPLDEPKETPAQRKQDRFLRNYRKMLSLKKAVELGLSDAAEYAKLEAKVKEDFELDYVDFIE